MKQRRVKVEHDGPTLQGEQLAELWVWIWTNLMERRRQAPAGPALDESERLLVAFERALDPGTGAYEPLHQRVTQDQRPERCALLAHYLFTRHGQWSARNTTDAPARLEVLEGAMTIFHRLLRASVAEMQLVCARMGVGDRYLTLFRSEQSSGVTLESPEEGPVPHAEYQRRLELARAAFQAELAAKREPKRRTGARAGGDR